MADELKPKFGDRLVNTVASARNPHREGIFVRAKRITGRFNPGLWFEMTDGNGEFWTSSAKFMALAHPAPAGEPQMPQGRLWVDADLLDSPINAHDDSMMAYQRREDAGGHAAPLHTADQLRAYGDARAEAARREAQRVPRMDEVHAALRTAGLMLVRDSQGIHVRPAITDAKAGAA